MTIYVGPILLGHVHLWDRNTLMVGIFLMSTYSTWNWCSLHCSLVVKKLVSKTITLKGTLVMLALFGRNICLVFMTECTFVL